MARPGRLTFAGLLIGAATVAAAADAPPPPGWYSKSGLSFVMTSGNSGTSTLGAKVEVKRLWPKATFALTGSAVRAEASDPSRRAVGGTEIPAPIAPDPVYPLSPHNPQHSGRQGELEP